MSYRHNYRSSGAPRASRWMALRYAGSCKVCGRHIPAGTVAFYDGATRLITCNATACADADGLTRQEWRGAPTSGQWVTVLADTRVGAGADPSPFARTRSRGYYGRDAGRCEDAPCCGCCS